MRHPLGRLLPGLAAVAWMALLGGCELASFVTQAAIDPKVKCLYEIQDRPTLVLVDDPAKLLGDPALAGVIADRIRRELRDTKAVATLVEPVRLRDEQARLGEAYATTPVDQLGRNVGAEQVIHVEIVEMQLEPAPGILRPKATTRVKLIDAKAGERLFPPTQMGQAASGVSPQPLGQPVVSELFYQQLPEDTRANLNRVVRTLADRIGRDVSWVFVDHKKRPTGSGFDD